MEFPFRKLDLYEVESRTESAKDVAATARRLNEDPEKRLRLEKQECVVCYYWNTLRAGGAAMSQTLCGGGCGTTIHSANTCLDRLCKSCAVKMRLCKHCGADMELKGRRKL